MKRLSIVFLILLSSYGLAAQHRFAWVTDARVGLPGASRGLDSCVQMINRMPEIGFVILSGDITEKGSNEEFENSKEILANLKVPYYVIPGSRDARLSESGLTKFYDLFGQGRFRFDYDDTRYIGLNSAITWQNGGHLSPEDLSFLQDSTGTEMDVVLVLHDPLNESIDNYFKAQNILSKHRIKAVLCGAGGENRILKFGNLPGAIGRPCTSGNGWGFTIVENKNDSLNFYEAGQAGTYRYWGSINKKEVLSSSVLDSVQFVNYGTKLLWQQDLKATMAAPLSFSEGKIFAAEKSGMLSCFDSTGTRIWQYDAFGDILSRPAIVDSTLVLGTMQGDLITVNTNTGESIQSVGFSNPITSQLLVIDYTGDRYKDLMIPKSTSSKAAVVLGTSNGRLACYDIETMQELWSNKDATGMIETRPVYADHKIYYGSRDGQFYCIDSRQGWMNWKWSADENSQLSAAATVPKTDGKNIYITSTDKFATKIDMLLGRALWRKNIDAWQSVGLSEDKSRVLVKNCRGTLSVLNAKDGKVLSSVKANNGPDEVPSEPIEYAGGIYFGSSDGNVYCVKNGRAEKILFLGTSRINSLINLGDGKFAAGNMDGHIAVFRVN